MTNRLRDNSASNPRTLPQRAHSTQLRHLITNCVPSRPLSHHEASDHRKQKQKRTEHCPTRARSSSPHATPANECCSLCDLKSLPRTAKQAKCREK